MNKIMKEKVSQILDRRYNQQSAVECPICGCNYSHDHVEELSCGGNWDGFILQMVDAVAEQDTLSVCDSD